MSNILSDIYKTYQKYVPTPLHQSFLVGGLTVPAVYLANKFMYNRLKRLAQDPRAAMLAGLTPQQAYQSLQQMQNSTFNKHVVPWLAGALAFAASAAPNVDFKSPYWGLTKWYPRSEKLKSTQITKAQDIPQGKTYNSPEELQADLDKEEDQFFGDEPGTAASRRIAEQSKTIKNAALKKYASLWGDQGYQPTFDFNTPIVQRNAVDLFANNPYIQKQDYERNLGTSIIMGAPAYGGQTTLGGIYDSAVNKFDKKLSFNGLAGSAIKGAVAGGLAGMFTDALGAVVGMPDPLRRSVANTVGFAKAMTTILA